MEFQHLPPRGIEERIKDLMARMSLADKIGQLQQITYSNQDLDKPTYEAIVAGKVGSFLNVLNVNVINKMQQAAAKSPLKIPLLVGKDVIHGFKTIFPIPLGQAASWRPELVEKAASVAAQQATNNGIRWTFTPMVDIARDPRWGRIAQGFGQDPFLGSVLGAASIFGYQGSDLTAPTKLAACGKHFVGYGAAQGGRDYNTTIIPINYLRDIYLKPFKALVEAGCQTFMTSFNQINGVPSSANPFTLRTVLRNEWKFDGIVVSDYTAVLELVNHGFCKDQRQCAIKCMQAGLDMQMVSTCYQDNLEQLVKKGDVLQQQINQKVANILRVKFRLGLFESPMTDPSLADKVVLPESRALSKQLALQSIVLLENDGILPLNPKAPVVGLVGVLADSPGDQLGCWIPDGDPKYSTTPLAYLKTYLKSSKVLFSKGVQSTRSKTTDLFEQAITVAKTSPFVIMVLGQDADLSGESHSRAYLDLPGVQKQLLQAVASVNKNIVLVVMAGRPLVLTELKPFCRAILYTWHLGIQAGSAIVDTLFGESNPSGKTPITFLRTIGQVPLYYSKKSTGRPNDGSKSIPFTTGYTDQIISPLYPFGFGLSYTKFQYQLLTLSSKTMRRGQKIKVSCFIFNTGTRAGYEVVQFYIQDVYGSNTRPVKQLRGFKKLLIQQGSRVQVQFTLSQTDLYFTNDKGQSVIQEGDFNVWIGSSSNAQLKGSFYYQP